MKIWRTPPSEISTRIHFGTESAVGAQEDTQNPVSDVHAELFPLALIHSELIQMFSADR